MFLHDTPFRATFLEDHRHRARDLVGLSARREVWHAIGAGEDRRIVCENVHIGVRPDPPRLTHVYTDVLPEEPNAFLNRVTRGDYLPPRRRYHATCVDIEGEHPLLGVWLREVVGRAHLTLDLLRDRGTLITGQLIVSPTASKNQRQHRCGQTLDDFFATLRRDIEERHRVSKDYDHRPISGMGRDPQGR